MNIKKYLKNKSNIYILLGIIFSSVLLFNISIFFSSIRNYLIQNVKKEIGDYHVIIKGNVENSDTFLKKEKKNDRIYITFKNIYRVYINTEKICQKNNCEMVTYNDTLLSLYGMSKKENIMMTMKKILVFISVSLSIILFFIIYNSFKVRVYRQKKEICLFKLAGCTNLDILKIYLKETSVLGITGIIIGFVISVIINIILIYYIGSVLGELFQNLKISIDPSFTIISFFLIIMIIISSLIPLKNITKYRPMELYRKTENIDIADIKIENNISLWLAKINYTRQNKKYRSLILSIFISCLFINIFSLFLKYGLRCIDKYIVIPKYDLIVISSDYDLKNISKQLKADKKVIYKSCNREVNISKEYYKNHYHEKENLLITNLGKNELINVKEKVKEKDKKISKEKYSIFKNLKTLNIDDQKIDIKLTDNQNKIISDNIIVNLEEDNFNKVCEESTNTLLLNTKYRGIDKYMEKLIKKEKTNINYINVKKEKEIITNIVVIIKVLMYLISLLIIIVTISSVVSITSATTEYRKKEINTFKSVGLENKKIIISLFIESLIVSSKGWLYSLPLIFIINKYMIISINEVFDKQKIIPNISIIIFSFILFEIIVFSSMIISNRRIKKEGIIDSIKER